MPNRLSRRMFALCLLLTWGWLALPARGGEAAIQSAVDADSGFTVYTLRAGETVLKVAPAAGCNAYSLLHKGRELLRTPPRLRELPGFQYGIPVLYPTPNRVRDGVFTFAGRRYEFKPNNEGNFLHGLVHNVPWEVVESQQKDQKCTLTCRLKFASPAEHFRLFPHPHELRLAFQVEEGSVRMTYTVDNSAGRTEVPFGFAFHPWFLYQGPRATTFLTIPARQHMQAEKLLPTGQLNALADSPLDARQPRSLAGFVIDDVYAGMVPDQPAIIDHRSIRLKLALQATADFTHLVVYTPRAPWFCVENQTCSTDAHNLAARGLNDVAHLQVVKPGGLQSGSVELRVQPY